ncbi:MAG: phosphoenolpyruvate carboxylase [Deltaproteobacteria bacterium]|nr:phosphoenolpyruvate carboxylase [Deltaproteobacteria bacterium]
MRKIPATMATQHPDNANIPYWGKSAAISTLEEVEECYHVFSDLGGDEYMWDWEGKFVDEAVVDRLFNRYHDYFRKNQLGKDKFLTFRIPNIWEEKGYRLARSYMTIITAAHTAEEQGLHVPPLFEVILPMTTQAAQLLTVLKKYKEALKYEEAIFEEKVAGRHSIELIPLIEGSVTLLHSRKILKDYAAGYERLFRKRLTYMRPFIARSDPALDAGFVPALLSARGAISEYYRFEEESGIRVYPIIGVGSLPFRGGLSPTTIDDFFKNYSGVRTVTIQSAFRYDYPLPQVKNAIRRLHRELPKKRAVRFNDREIRELTILAEHFASFYRPVVTRLAPVINQIARFVPSHRERIPHTGHFGYSRKVGRDKTKMPRAIAFVAALASIGIPPSLIGTGRALRAVIRNRQEKLLERFLPTFQNDLENVGNYLNWENLKFLARGNPGWSEIREDVLAIEDYLGKRIGPQKTEHFIHRNLTSNIYHLWQEGKGEITEEILHAAKVRRSLG